MANVIPEVTFNEGVKEFLGQSFCNEKAVSAVGEEKCQEKLSDILRSLSYPPSYTVLRINTLHHSKQDVFHQLTQVLVQQYKSRERLPPTVDYHASLDDTLVISSPTGHSKRHEVCPEANKEVIVDRQCGLAVLRGADVYAPGIMAATQDIIKGDKVSVFVDIDSQCRKGFIHRFKGNKAFIGNGCAAMSRKDLFVGNSSPRGMGVHMTEPIFDCPSLNGVLVDRLFLQNLPSIVVSHVLNPQPGRRLLDMCAAPGGKTTHLATLMKDQGVVIALDKSPSKINKIKQNARRMGLNCIQTFVYDSTKACCMQSSCNSDAPPFSPESFDYILLDAPCSGLGQRPQIANQLQLSEVKSYPAYQRQFFSTAVKLLRPGGYLVYSTCTITLGENEEIVSWALKDYPQLQLCQQVPHLGGIGLLGTMLQPDQLCKLQRFHGVSPMISCANGHSDNDTIGFFVAKFVKQFPS
ncbi:tRNA (cytosine(72)-C(5))-methyltransferase NSUN6-like [Asterias rubens]|uniref:tRNA (cytosine(72)-C(5))-methyltransferase NSUN6-like n=1 Tax=Asterias rubens TaxID=7604 RepID=UPI0014553B09|nr:tRNA (cytosine(72)-C(5))-methyltransferase NSUN6-like [Asterias rubens]